MKTFILVWFLVSPTNDDGTVEWEAGVSKPMTQDACELQLAEDDLSYYLMEQEGVLQGHSLYCKDTRGKSVPIVRT